MRGNDEVSDQALKRVHDLADEHATIARVRAALAKRRELVAHARAIELHERAARLQQRLGRPDRAATARAHAEHARELQRQALEELRDQER